jgi:esterase/lipase superfamily enzyme
MRMSLWMEYFRDLLKARWPTLKSMAAALLIAVLTASGFVLVFRHQDATPFERTVLGILFQVIFVAVWFLSYRYMAMRRRNRETEGERAPPDTGTGARGTSAGADGWNPTARPRAPYEWPTKPEGSRDVREVMFATNRLVLEGVAFSLDAITAVYSECPTYGSALVNIPRKHKIGVVERPKFDWWSLRREEEGADKHFMLLELSKMADDDFFSALRSPENSALVFVHGYNTSFQDAVFKAAQIAFDANFPGKVIAFSWPSGALATLYDYDRETALASPKALLKLLRRIKSDAKVEYIFLVAHSLGSQIVIDALQMASLLGADLNLREVVFAAPDVDRNVFTSRAELIKKVAGGATLYASSADKALKISKAKAGGTPRAGDMPPIGPLLIPGIDLIDVTALGEDMFALNHGVFASDRSVLDDLGRIIMTRTRPPHVRTPTLQRMPDRTAPRYWMYPH